MRPLAYCMLALGSAAALPLHAQSAALDAAAAAMGGKARLLAVRTIVLEGAGEQLQFGQNHTPFADTRFEVTSVRRVYDLQHRRWFQDQTRVPRFVTANMNPQRLRIALDGHPGGVAYTILPTGVVTRASAQAHAERFNEFMLHPVTFVAAAASPGAVVTEAAPAPGTRAIRLTLAEGDFLMLADTATGLPLRLERGTYHPMLGDVTLIADLSDWQGVDGVRLPMRLTLRYENLYTLADYRFRTALVNQDPGDIAASDSIRNVAPPVPATPVIAVDTIAPGVWAVAGQSHHTIAVEQSNQVMLVEAPQNDARTLAAIARARQLRPHKPVSVLVNTHHHFDHAGGLRAAIAEGLTIVTHEGNREFYERIVFPRRHSVSQDALALNMRPLSLVPVADRHVRPDALRPVEIYSVPSDHSGSMLVVYLPNERILIQADLYNPPPPTAVNPVFPFARALVDAVQKRGLAVERVVGVHGRPVPWSEVVAAASR